MNWHPRIETLEALERELATPPAWLQQIIDETKEAIRACFEPK